MSKIKIGIIGTGYMGGTHAQLYARNERTEVHAIYDVKPERMQRVSKQTGAKCMENGEQVIESCDAIVVTTPNSRHTKRLPLLTPEKQYFRKSRWRQI
jgi:predicted dehydrogenase